MAGRICQTCASAELTRRASKLIAEGVSDRHAAIQLGLGDSDAARMAYSRHRRNCVEKVAKAVVRTCDQILVVTSGSGMVANEREQHEINVGDVVHIKSGERHWHGAKADTTMGHITITLVGSQAAHG